jgi:hypothetical protein
MAKEVLHVPEEYLTDVIAVIRAGLKARPETPAEIAEGLEFWCASEEAYMGENDGDDD